MFRWTNDFLRCLGDKLVVVLRKKTIKFLYNFMRVNNK